MENCANSLNNVKRNEKKGRRHFSINPPPKHSSPTAFPAQTPTLSKGISSEMIMAATWVSLVGEKKCEENKL